MTSVIGFINNVMTEFLIYLAHAYCQKKIFVHYFCIHITMFSFVCIYSFLQEKTKDMTLTFVNCGLLVVFF